MKKLTQIINEVSEQREFKIGDFVKINIPKESILHKNDKKDYNGKIGIISGVGSLGDNQFIYSINIETTRGQHIHIQTEKDVASPLSPIKLKFKTGKIKKKIKDLKDKDLEYSPIHSANLPSTDGYTWSLRLINDFHAGKISKWKAHMEKEFPGFINSEITVKFSGNIKQPEITIDHDAFNKSDRKSKKEAEEIRDFYSQSPKSRGGYFTGD